MELARISSKGQITIPIEVRKEMWEEKHEDNDWY